MDKEKCIAKSKQSGQRCKNYPSKGKRVCRFHGGQSTGARTEAGKRRIKDSRTIHGFYSKEALEERRFFREFVNFLENME